ncbi:hypothetical protein EDB81DRAFT_778941 [Dactylonectria macrodidyma]|uniref:Heparan-alpha-glucosaminide N-acetyltransferase catalytic domain-containing protein n=1 Tax=Dactylonectria macrodidyma TaxID=307937 RepID=A0A9P9FKY0_9HYPO|nr:hypothetical protein EDB81DRAFT_778941 [Dactylonectria macrodidyma]
MTQTEDAPSERDGATVGGVRMARRADRRSDDDFISHGITNGIASSYGSIPSSNPASSSPSKSSPNSSTRALAPDLLRGFLMLTMALDHTALALNTWEHGTGRTSEMDGAVVTSWNRRAAYLVRSLTHLCAPGFTFLLGVGVVYLGRSRTRLGWSSGRIARYFAVRCGVLTVVNVVLGLAVSAGEVWFMNFVLFALAVDYFLAGMLWLVIDETEPLLARSISGLLPDDANLLQDDAEEPLLRPSPTPQSPRVSTRVSTRASTMSWHIHNALLGIVSLVTIWWNHWLSPTGGHCDVQSNDNNFMPTTAPGPGLDTPAISHHPLLGIWFWVVESKRVMSPFPPLAWLSFAIVGLLYARIILARPWSRRDIALGHSLVGLLFFIFFVLTRVLRFGNLSEGCLHTPEHDKHPNQNPYLVSGQSFFYIIKYPPDVAFWAFTLAGNFFLLALFGGFPVRISQRLTILLDFGRAALFFYIAHLFAVFIFGAVLVRLFGHDVGIPSPQDPDNSKGIDNVWAYLTIWAALMLLLWPATRWYSRFKSTKPADSIWRFF